MCKGSMKYVHYNCIQQWRRTSKNVLSYVQCENCCATYSNIPDIKVKNSVVDYWLNNVQLIHNAKIKYDKLHSNNNSQQSTTSIHDSHKFTQYSTLMAQYYALNYPVIQYDIDIQIAKRLLHRQQQALDTYKRNKHKRNSNTITGWFVNKYSHTIYCTYNVLIIPLLIMCIGMMLEYYTQDSIDLIKHLTFTVQCSLFTVSCILIISFVRTVCSVIFQEEETFT